MLDTRQRRIVRAVNMGQLAIFGGLVVLDIAFSTVQIARGHYGSLVLGVIFLAVNVPLLLLTLRAIKSGSASISENKH